MYLAVLKETEVHTYIETIARAVFVSALSLNLCIKYFLPKRSVTFNSAVHSWWGDKDSGLSSWKSSWYKPAGATPGWAWLFYLLSWYVHLIDSFINTWLNLIPQVLIVYIGLYFQKETQIYAAPDMPLSSGFSKISRNDISVTPFSAVDPLVWQLL